MHYFLWLRDAPDLSYLDEWVRETALKMFGKDSVLDEGMADQLVARLNERAAAAVCDCDADVTCACNPTTRCSGCECDCHLPLSKAQFGATAECNCDCKAARDATIGAMPGMMSSAGPSAQPVLIIPPHSGTRRTP